MKCERCGKEMKHIEGAGYYCADFNCKPPKHNRAPKGWNSWSEAERTYYLVHNPYS